jgi:hypothetical protein
MQLHKQFSDTSIIFLKDWKREGGIAKHRKAGEKWQELKQFVDELQQEIDEPC